MAIHQDNLGVTQPTSNFHLHTCNVYVQFYPYYSDNVTGYRSFKEWLMLHKNLVILGPRNVVLGRRGKYHLDGGSPS